MSEAMEIQVINNQEFDCPICRETLLDPISLFCCGSNFCLTCVENMKTTIHCPCCRKHINIEGYTKNILLSGIIEKVMGSLWIQNERRIREERQQEAKKIKRISKQYDESFRFNVIRDCLKSLLKPEGILFLLNDTYKKATAIKEILPSGQSPLSVEEFLYHVDKLTNNNYLRVGTVLILTKPNKEDLLQTSLIDNCLPALPLCLSLLGTDEMAKERFLNLNRELIGTEQPIVFSRAKKDSFVHLLTEADIQDEDKMSDSSTKRAAIKAKSAPPKTHSSSSYHGGVRYDKL